jgi:hypothetical protein
LRRANRYADKDYIAEKKNLPLRALLYNRAACKLFDATAAGKVYSPECENFKDAAYNLCYIPFEITSAAQLRGKQLSGRPPGTQCRWCKRDIYL